MKKYLDKNLLKLEYIVGLEIAVLFYLMVAISVLMVQFLYRATKKYEIIPEKSYWVVVDFCQGIKKACKTEISLAKFLLFL